jgi:hypothetical protein
MRIYITHPYGRRRNEPQKVIDANVEESIRLAREVIKLGHNPYIPNLMHFVHKDWEETPDEVVWGELTSEWIRFCDAILYTKASTGCDHELVIAAVAGLIVFRSLEEIPAVTDQMRR